MPSKIEFFASWRHPQKQSITPQNMPECTYCAREFVRQKRDLFRSCHDTRLYRNSLEAWPKKGNQACTALQ